MNKAKSQKKSLRISTGKPPGTIIFTGDKKTDKIHIHYLEYKGDIFNEEERDSSDLRGFHMPTDAYVQWYDFRGLHDTRIVQEIGDIFKIHPLVLEDIVDVHQRPKFDVYDKYCFLKFDGIDYVDGQVIKESIAVLMGNGYVISFQEDKKDTFYHVRDRIRTNAGRITDRGADYLAYALLDSVVDRYYEAIDAITDEVERLDEQITMDAQESIKKDIQNLKIEFLKIRKSISPLREAINQFAKSDYPIVEDKTRLFLRDVYDHTVQIMDHIETNRDILSGLQDLYISEISFKMNKVMQVLTIVTTIFVPLSFLVGLYGMNFEYIPELKYKYGYFVLVGLMIVLVVSLLALFKRRNWL